MGLVDRLSLDISVEPVRVLRFRRRTQCQRIQREGSKDEKISFADVHPCRPGTCGGGYHGKSTLLQAIARGVYNHIPGDGRELVVSDENAVKIRAEDGRAVSDVNISCFIDDLPFNKDTQHFYTDNGSGRSVGRPGASYPDVPPLQDARC